MQDILPIFITFSLDITFFYQKKSREVLIGNMSKIGILEGRILIAEDLAESKLGILFFN